MEHTVCCFCQAENSAIIQLYCIIKGLVRQGFRITNDFSLSIFHSLDKFRTAAVVWKL